ncbi:hypothetical protein [Actinoplanes sp. NPDC051494]|uniref:hypothetical protein n=1 Tax=Actinoplanes sp. NPDC051494 TaxID=3363907 RepID=UPI0037A7AF28
MTEPVPNHGVIMSGDATVNAGAFAVGRDPHATNSVVQETSADPVHAEVSQRLAELIELIRAHTAELPNSGELLGATGTIAQELSREKPNAFTVTALLSALAAGVRPVGEVAAAVKELTEAAQGLF